MQTKTKYEQSLDSKMRRLIGSIDFKLLKEQKSLLLEMSTTSENRDGLLGLIDALQDFAVDALHMDKKDVFNFDTKPREAMPADLMSLAESVNSLEGISSSQPEWISRAEVLELLSKQAGNGKTIEESAREFLSFLGFYTENLWSIDDVQTLYECSDEQAHNLLHNAMQNEATIDQVWLSIKTRAEGQGFTKKGDTK